MAEELGENKTAPSKKAVKKSVKQKKLVKKKKDVEKVDKILLGVSKKISKITGVDINVVRVLFFLSAILVIGIPIYLILSVILKD